jgi:formate-dependent nitrite reductase membrane component NrfD
MNDNEVGIYIMLGGIAGFAFVVTMLDWWGRRQQRRHQKQ